MGDHQHGHPLFGQTYHDIENFLDHFRIKGRCRFVEKHNFRIHAEAAGNRDPLLLTTGELAGKFLSLLGDINLFQIHHGRGFSLFFGFFAHPDRTESKIFQNRQVGKKIEMLKDHTDLGPNFLNIFNIVGQFSAINDDLTALMFLQTVDTANQGRFTRS